MPRVKQVRKSRKDQGKCGQCRTELPSGSAYVWWAFRYGGRRVRCTAKACYPRPSDLTQSEFLGLIYSAQELLSDAEGGTTDDLVGALEEAESNAREAAELRNDSADRIEEHFEGSTKAEELREEGEQAEAWADALEEAKSEIEGLDEDDYTSQARDEFDDGDIEEGEIVARGRELLDEEAENQFSTAVDECQI